MKQGVARGPKGAQEFCRLVADRARKERPDIRVEPAGRFLLLVETEPGQERLVSLEALYQACRESPRQRDEVIEDFLAAHVYDDPSHIGGGFDENRHRIMPQVVPPTLLGFCRMEGRELAALDHIGGLAVAFVVDEPERYCYIHRSVMLRWGVSEVDLLTAALENLEGLHRQTPSCCRFGQGERLALVWETFDGYDASRILLTRELSSMAGLVAGNPVIAIPHRDYLVMIGDADPDFVAEVADRVREDFESHCYPITPRFFTLADGVLAPYSEGLRLHRKVN